MSETPRSIRFTKEREERPRVRTEQEYIEACVAYALSTGWIKENEKEVLVKKYLKPIHGKYLEIIDDLRKEDVLAKKLARIIERLNNCLDATRRIGSTDPNNIIRTIEDARNRAQWGYEEYALGMVSDFIAGLLREQG